MNVGDFLVTAKGLSRYGDPTITSDTQETQLLASLNRKAGRVWAKWDWPWSLEELSFAIAASTARFDVVAKSGNKISRITEIYPHDYTVNPPVWGEPLKQCSRYDFYKRYASSPPPYPPGYGAPGYVSPGLPRYYVNLGFDPANAGVWRIEVAPLPNQAFTMSGWAKALRVPFTLADAVANNPITYFPADILDDVLMNGVLSDAFHYAGNDAEADRYSAMFEAGLKEKVDEQENAAQDQGPITTPPNAELSRRQAMRSMGGTSVI